MLNPIDFSSLVHVVIVVKNIEESLKKWVELFAIPMPEIRVQKPTDEVDLTYRGKKAAYGRKLAVMKFPGFMERLV